MPELPEVETVRWTLARAVVGQVIIAVDVRRKSVVEGSATAAALLVGRRIAAIERHGKELLIRSAPVAKGGRGSRRAAAATQRRKNGSAGALPSPLQAEAITDQGDRCLIVHLGMTGSLFFEPPAGMSAPPTRRPRQVHPKHVHVMWKISGGGQIVFHDPRRFGGIWTFVSRNEVQAKRWHRLGPDAQKITAAQLGAGLARTRRAIKAALLDQRVVAGLGNIYVDELLFACRIHPATPGNSLKAQQVGQLIRKVRPILKRAIKARGSTLRDYRDARGRKGRFQFQHQVYGRGGENCRVCSAKLNVARIGGRTTVYCKNCQPG